jgi:flagellar biosynthesis/type III secretory pathway M-ring protein FliF/YscJ
MGGLIFILLVALAVFALVSPALRARAKARREDIERAAEEAVVRRLDDHRRRKRRADDVIDGK